MHSLKMDIDGSPFAEHIFDNYRVAKQKRVRIKVLRERPPSSKSELKMQGR